MPYFLPSANESQIWQMKEHLNMIFTLIQFAIYTEIPSQPLLITDSGN